MSPGSRLLRITWCTQGDRNEYLEPRVSGELISLSSYDLESCHNSFSKWSLVDHCFIITIQDRMIKSRILVELADDQEAFLGISLTRAVIKMCFMTSKVCGNSRRWLIYS
jgi:hypothetical protein